MRLLLLRFLATACLLGATNTAGFCASPADADDDTADASTLSDPAEPLNRAIFRLNMVIDHALVRPVARAYKDNMPEVVQTGVHNFLTNLDEPKVMVNDLLQGNVRRALSAGTRFVMNTTAGAVGLVDVGAGVGLPHHDADFGQTFGVWGVGAGPAVQLPLLGPSNIRDTAGTVAGFFGNPLSFIPGGTAATIQTSATGAGVVDGRAQVVNGTDELEKSSLDYYATLRSVAAQRRDSLVEEGRKGDLPP